MRCLRCGLEWRPPWWLVALIVLAVLLAGASSVLGWQAWGAKRDYRAGGARADSLVEDWSTRRCVPLP